MKQYDNLNEAQFIHSTIKKCILLYLGDGNIVELYFGKNSVKVKSSYLYNKEQLDYISSFIYLYIKEIAEYEMTRNIKQIYGELRLHVLLYKLHIKRENTADIEYTKGFRWYINLLSNIIGFLHL